MSILLLYLLNCPMSELFSDSSVLLEFLFLLNVVIFYFLLSLFKFCSHRHAHIANATNYVLRLKNFQLSPNFVINTTGIIWKI